MSETLKGYSQLIKTNYLHNIHSLCVDNTQNTRFKSLLLKKKEPKTLMFGHKYNFILYLILHFTQFILIMF